MTSAVSRALHRLGRPHQPHDKVELSRTPSPGSSFDARDSHVRDRLHALFGSHSVAPSPSPAALSESPTTRLDGQHRGIRIDTAHIGPDGLLSPSHDSGITASPLDLGAVDNDGKHEKEESAVKDRQAIKVFVVTWNMGDALVSSLACHRSRADSTSRKATCPSCSATYRSTTNLHALRVCQNCP